ncbi:hypothetical protein DAEQUDRAFT_731811 [Daedalea quercina L-15889]|uniref:Uncharacterized protein n=1 Tax=Daedalea quercina L-15889 TaxID=1314783 RepID=A0A165M0C1_9APHY|nr:hypothetical protein DAEQUDRAFT_731811 [Daedalea quercina L-15889]
MPQKTVHSQTPSSSTQPHASSLPHTQAPSSFTQALRFGGGGKPLAGLLTRPTAIKPLNPVKPTNVPKTHIC